MDRIDEVFSYHPPKDDQPQRYQELRAKAKELAKLIDSHCPESPERSVALRKLRESVMWANAAIAINE